jgi:hypothetical protein
MDYRDTGQGAFPDVFKASQCPTLVGIGKPANESAQVD